MPDDVKSERPGKCQQTTYTGHWYLLRGGDAWPKPLQENEESICPTETLPPRLVDQLLVILLALGDFITVMVILTSNTEFGR